MTTELDQEETVSKLKFQISMSLDGFVAGPNQTEEDPLAHLSYGVAQ